MTEPGREPRLTAVYVNFRCEDLIVRSLERLRRSVGSVSLQVVVADNGPSKPDGFWNGRDLIHLPAGGNLGFGKACNLGATTARGEYLLFLNPDTLPDGDTVERLVEYMDSHPDASACGPRLVGADGRTQVYWNYHHLLRWEFAEAFYLQGAWRKIFERRMRRVHGQEAAWPVEFVSGACLLVRREAFEAVGGFDPRFFMNFEDFEICRRLQSLGGIRYLPWLSMLHEEGSVQRSNWGGFVQMRNEAHLVYIDIAYHGARRTLARGIQLAVYLSRLAIGLVVLRGAQRTRLEGYLASLRSLLGRPAQRPA